MNKLLLIIYFLSITITGNAFNLSFTTLEGKVTDEYGIPLEYVNIGIVGTSIGTVSNENGQYLLNVKSSIEGKSKVCFSSIGYKSKTFLLEHLIQKGFANIHLEIQINLLQTVLVKPEFKNIKEVGTEKIETKRFVKFAIREVDNQNLGAEVGKRFKIKENAFLESYRFYIQKNNFDTIQLRINIYSVSDNMPDETLLKKHIIKEVTNQYTGWVEVDLSSYELYCSSDVIASVAWVGHSQKGDQLALPIKTLALGNQHYYKFASQDRWREYKRMSSSMKLKYSY